MEDLVDEETGMRVALQNEARAERANQTCEDDQYLLVGEHVMGAMTAKIQ